MSYEQSSGFIKSCRYLRYDNIQKTHVFVLKNLAHANILSYRTMIKNPQCNVNVINIKTLHCKG